MHISILMMAHLNTPLVGNHMKAIKNYKNLF